MPKSKKPKKYKMHHGIFAVCYEPLYGISQFPEHVCEENQNEEFWVWINPDRCKTSSVKLDTLIHELLHCEHPDMSEEDVERTATNIANVLHGEGWREKQ